MANIKATIRQHVIKATIKGTGAQGLTGATGPQGLGSNKRNYTWILDNPSVGGIPGPELQELHTITKIKSHVRNILRT